ncbi:DUF1731 domain-containing protein [Nitrosomonas sp. JL21]|uniref:DUF1731 domain-containing protein n=1 Tax=Nitrosomonas sp. JL21 TaxID=153949 RepID=UPI0031F3EBE2
MRYREFTAALGEALHRPALLPVPAMMLKLALGEAAALALNSYHIAPKRLIEELKFQFTFPHLSAALQDIVAKS